MTKFLKVNRVAAILMLAAGMSLECQMAFAGPDAEQEAATVISIAPDETPAAADASAQAADVTPDGVAVPESAAQGDTANAGKDAKKPEQKETLAATHIPSTNPDDVNKHPAWRKRDANKAIGELRKLKGQLMLQGASE